MEGEAVQGGGAGGGSWVGVVLHRVLRDAEGVYGCDAAADIAVADGVDGVWVLGEGFDVHGGGVACAGRGGGVVDDGGAVAAIFNGVAYDIHGAASGVAVEVFLVMADAEPLAGCLGGSVFQKGQGVGSIVKLNCVEEGC